MAQPVRLVEPVVQRPPQASPGRSAPAERRALPPDAVADVGAYRRWVAARQAQRLTAAPEPALAPELTVLVVVEDADAARLRRTLESVADQTSDRWRLSVTVVGDTVPAVDAVLAEEPARAGRRRVSLHTAAARSDRASVVAGALEVSGAPAWLLLDPGDVLAPDAVALLGAALRDADVAYADEDQIDDDGGLAEPIFKPDWSPERELPWPYTGRPTVLRVAPVIAAGGVRPVPGGDWEHDLVLRVTERTPRVVHVAEVLCHRPRAARASAGAHTSRRAGNGPRRSPALAE